MTNPIKVEVLVNAPLEKVWHDFTSPDAITRWNNASDDWHTTRAENDLRVGGRFLSRMEAKDGSAGFDFSGEYTDVVEHEKISFTMDDNRKVETIFVEEGENVRVTSQFEPESENSVEMQQAGWQAILDNFKKYAES